MSDRARLLSEVSKQEGFVAKLYLDTEKLVTFGKGRCVETHPLSGSEWKTLYNQGWIKVEITEAGADWLMQEELMDVERQLARDYSSFWSYLNDARQNALIEMAYQMGADKEEAFHDMIAAIRVAIENDTPANWATVRVCGLSSLWAKETPSRAIAVMTQLENGVFA